MVECVTNPVHCMGKDYSATQAAHIPQVMQKITLQHIQYGHLKIHDISSVC